jgi:hypothetical protein
MPLRRGYPLAVLAEKSADPFPIVDNIWNMFARKGNKTVFLSVGGSKTCLPDLELAETLGCPFHIVPVTAQQRAHWAEVGTSLKARSRPADAQYEFSAGAEEKWILPKNFRVGAALPWWTEGSISVSGETVPTRPFFDVAKDVCIAMNLGETRIDILKVDCGGTLERPLLTALLENNLRPAILLVRWSVMPDQDTSTSITAGHLQNCGYTLVDTRDDKFLYFYTDQDIYMSCSWEDYSTLNPMIQGLLDSFQTSFKKTEGDAKDAPPKNSIPSGGETVPKSSGASTTNGS